MTNLRNVLVQTALTLALTTALGAALFFAADLATRGVVIA